MKPITFLGVLSMTKLSMYVHALCNCQFDFFGCIFDDLGDQVVQVIW